MAYVCFKCLQSFTTTKLLWYHLRTVHHITTKSKIRIVCGQVGCTQVYYHGYSYKRHLNRDHMNNAPQNELDVAVANEILEDEVELNENMSDDDEHQEVVNEIQPRSKAQILEDAKDATVNYVTCLKGSKLPTSTVQVFLNESRNLVDNIVSGIEEIARPILEDVQQNRVPSEDKVQNFRTVLNTLKDPLETFSLTSEYKQKQFLSKAEVMVEPRQITLGKVHKEHLNNAHLCCCINSLLMFHYFQFSEEQKNLAFFILPYVFHGRKEKGGRASVKETCDYFIDFQKVRKKIDKIVNCAKTV